MVQQPEGWDAFETLAHSNGTPCMFVQRRGVTIIPTSTYNSLWTYFHNRVTPQRERRGCLIFIPDTYIMTKGFHYGILASGPLILPARHEIPHIKAYKNPTNPWNLEPLEPVPPLSVITRTVYLYQHVSPSYRGPRWACYPPNRRKGNPPLSCPRCLPREKALGAPQEAGETRAYWQFLLDPHPGPLQ